MSTRKQLFIGAALAVILLGIILTVVWSMQAKQSAPNTGKTTESANEATHQRRTTAILLSSQAELDAAGKKSNANFQSQPAAPEVNWNEKSLVKLTYQAPSSGYTLSSRTDGEIITLTIRQPDAKCAQKQAVTPLVNFVEVSKISQVPELKFMSEINQNCIQ